MHSLPADPPAFASTATRGRGDRLSRRRVRALVAIGQRWCDAASGECWQVKQVHRRDVRGDGTVDLQRLGERRCGVTFGELGSRYDLLEGDA